MRYRHSLELLLCLRLPFSGKQPTWLVSGAHTTFQLQAESMIVMRGWCGDRLSHYWPSVPALIYHLQFLLFRFKWFIKRNLCSKKIASSVTFYLLQQMLWRNRRENVKCKDILLQLSAHWWTAKIIGFRSRCRKALNWCTLHTAQHGTLHNSAHFTVCVQSLTLDGGRVQFYASPSLHPSIFPLMQVLSATH